MALSASWRGPQRFGTPLPGEITSKCILKCMEEITDKKRIWKAKELRMTYTFNYLRFKSGFVRGDLGFRVPLVTAAAVTEEKSSETEVKKKGLICFRRLQRKRHTTLSTAK
ncbi:hypothetical protein F2Q70_00010543 [Brassica cretica]|uniref:Uncharacterized protein n=1 Tax=Brassica cretica TaxID=69181 RepID=A0A8S9LZE0_BRACR|nr:hypothetical protein F2Q70_00010543 [Brassica cretica]